MTKVLNLTLKKKWFDMILSGEKKEEYREIKPYWLKRLTQTEGTYADECERLKEGGESCSNLPFGGDKIPIRYGYCFPIKYDTILFKNGYSKNAPCLLIECIGIKVSEAKPEWSDNWQGKVFVIKLGEIINNK